MAVAYDRPELDFYSTPTWATDVFLDVLKSRIAPPAKILEPSAGDGALLDPIARTWPAADIDARDIAPPPEASDIVHADFFFNDTPDAYDLVVTNPPYAYAESFVWLGLSKLNTSGHLALLLRIGFIGPAERSEMWRNHMPKWAFVLKQRPKFKANATDSQPSAWMVWDTKPCSVTQLEVIG